MAGNLVSGIDAENVSAGCSVEYKYSQDVTLPNITSECLQAHIRHMARRERVRGYRREHGAYVGGAYRGGAYTGVGAVRGGGACARAGMVRVQAAYAYAGTARTRVRARAGRVRRRGGRGDGTAGTCTHAWTRRASAGTARTGRGRCARGRRVREQCACEQHTRARRMRGRRGDHGAYAGAGARRVQQARATAQRVRGGRRARETARTRWALCSGTARTRWALCSGGGACAGGGHGACTVRTRDTCAHMRSRSRRACGHGTYAGARASRVHKRTRGGRGKGTARTPASTAHMRGASTARARDGHSTVRTRARARAGAGVHGSGRMQRAAHGGRARRAGGSGQACAGKHGEHNAPSVAFLTHEVSPGVSKEMEDIRICVIGHLCHASITLFFLPPSRIPALYATPNGPSTSHPPPAPLPPPFYAASAAIRASTSHGSVMNADEFLAGPMRAPTPLTPAPACARRRAPNPSPTLHARASIGTYQHPRTYLLPAFLYGQTHDPQASHSSAGARLHQNRRAGLPQHPYTYPCARWLAPAPGWTADSARGGQGAHAAYGQRTRTHGGDSMRVADSAVPTRAVKRRRRGRLRLGERMGQGAADGQRTPAASGRRTVHARARRDEGVAAQARWENARARAMDSARPQRAADGQRTLAHGGNSMHAVDSARARARWSARAYAVKRWRRGGAGVLGKRTGQGTADTRGGQAHAARSRAAETACARRTAGPVPTRAADRNPHARRTGGQHAHARFAAPVPEQVGGTCTASSAVATRAAVTRGSTRRPWRRSRDHASPGLRFDRQGLARQAHSSRWAVPAPRQRGGNPGQRAAAL
ncbi:hypothetical protein GGX14DRAFT_402455 [Mycena pura]|uniref:Uncharacterized protein n=1 Tax=Mycena pura TaxID=153505 RepID=A0AAD6UY80_9AGAR|nr:hypothetical protein GGX14DRAFT_402455 [Mycena pura]